MALAKWKSGFKVVAQNADGEWVSALVGGLGNAVYAVGAVTTARAKCGPLCVFSTPKGAIKFMQAFGCAIFTCEYKPSRRRTVWDGDESSRLRNLPVGTVLADRVKLLERVL